MPNSTVINGQPYEALMKWLNQRNYVLRKVGNRLLGGRRHWIEYYLDIKSKKKQDVVVHFIYGENQYKNFWKYKGNRKIVCTFHQSPERFEKFLQQNDKYKIRAFRGIDKAIAVSRNQVQILEKMVGKGKVEFVPHGVDTEYFGVDKTITRENKIITVGNWLRDFNKLRKICEYVFQENPKVLFEVTAVPRHRPIFEGLPNVKFRFNISSDELRQSYQSAKFLFLPLKGATANNAFLESMACGLPAMVTDLPALRDYANESHTVFIPKEASAEEYGQKILKLIDDTQTLNLMSISARENAEKFSWENICLKLREIYTSLIN
jgi:glycosyltransferase involved in cell wall biosynthesis